MAKFTLLDTVILGDSTRVRQLVLDGWDVNSPDEYNRTYLHWAAQGNNTDVIKLLLECRADPCVRTAAGVCPLHIAIYCGHREAVRLLVAAGARLTEPDTYPFDRHAVHWAAKSGDLELVKILVERAEVPLSYVDVVGRTPAQLASDLGHVKIARYLLLMSGSPMPDGVALSLDDPNDFKDGNDGGDEEPATDAALHGISNVSQKPLCETSAKKKIKRSGKKIQESNNNKKANGASAMSNSDDDAPLPTKRISGRSGRAVVEDSSDDDENQSLVQINQCKSSKNTRPVRKEKRISKTARKNTDDWVPGNGESQRSAKSSKSTNRKTGNGRGGKEEAEKDTSALSKKRRMAVRLDIYNELFKNDVDDDLSFAGKIPKKKRRSEGWNTERS